MSLIDQLRASRPDLEELKDLTDSDLVSMYSQVTGASLDLSAMDLGLDPQDYTQNKGRGEDLVNQGILGLGDIVGGVAGFLDIPVAGATGYAPLSSAVDWAADVTGLSDYGRRLELTMSPQSQQTNAAWDKTWNDEEMGAWDKAKNLAGVVWDDPAYALEFAARSAPTLIPAFGTAKLLGMGAKAMEAAGLTRTAAAARPLIPGMAEGGVAAGYQMNNLLGEDVDPREAAGYSALTGIGTGIIGGVTGALGARAGLTDPHRLIAGYRLPGEAPALPYYKRIPGGMALEAGQEALQSPWEQAMTNVATGEEWDQGLARSAVEGAIGGGIIGAPFNVFRGREIDLLKTQDAPEAEPQPAPTPPGVNPPGSQAPNIDPLAAERQRQIDSIMGGETSQTILPGQTDPGSLQGLTRDQINQRMIDAAMGGEAVRTFAPGQYPSDVAADLSQQQAKVNAVRAADQAKKAVEKQYEKAGWQKTPEKIALLETAQAPKLVSGIYGDEARKFVDSVLTMDAKTAGELFTNLSSSKSKSAPWKAAVAKAHLTNLAQQEAQTLAQQAKQNAAIDAPGVPVTPVIAQNAQPTEGAVGPTPTTSSVAQDEVPPPDVTMPSPPPPTTPEITTNALSGQTTPQAGQETGTTAPDATAEPGVAGAPNAPRAAQRVVRLPQEALDSQRKMYFVAPGKLSKMWALYEYDPAAPKGSRRSYVVNLATNRDEAEAKALARVGAEEALYSFDRETTPILRGAYPKENIEVEGLEDTNLWRTGMMLGAGSAPTQGKVVVDRKGPIPEQRAAVLEAVRDGRVSLSSPGSYLGFVKRGRSTVLQIADTKGKHVSKLLDAAGVDYKNAKGLLEVGPQDHATAYRLGVEYWTNTPWEQIVGTNQTGETSANPSPIQSDQETVPVPGAASASVQVQGSSNRELAAKQGGQTADAGQAEGQVAPKSAWAEEPAPAGEVIASYPNPEEGTEGRVVKRPDGKFASILWDTDVDQPVGITVHPDETGAHAKAQQAAKTQGGSAQFARKPNKAQQRSGNTVADVERWIAGPKAKLAQWVTNGLNVVQSVDELRARYLGMDIPDDVVGMHEGGYVFLVADNITNANQARKALAHEVVGHLGLERMLGKKGFERIVRQIDSYIRTQNPAVLQALERVKAKYTDDQGKYNLNQVQEASEILAHLAERNPNFGLIREIIARIRMWFAKHGLGNYAAAELNQLLVEAARFTETGFTSFAEGNFRVAPAYMVAGGRPTQRSGVNAEVAPDPRRIKAGGDQTLQRWAELTYDDQLAITQTLGDSILPRLLQQMGAQDYRVEYTMGGFKGASNPSITIHFGQNVPYDLELEVANTLGVLWRQQAMIAYNEDDTSTGDQVQFVKVIPDRKLSVQEQRDLFANINRLYPQAEGVSTRDGALVFGNFVGATEREFHEGVRDTFNQLETKYNAEIPSFVFRSDWIEPPTLENTDYGQSYNTQTASGRDVLRRRQRNFDSLQSESDALFKAAVDATWQRGRRPNAGRDERAGGRDDRSVPPEYGKARAGAIRGVGVHFSQAERQELDGSYYGTGLQGKEAQRVFTAADQRLRQRVYFYINSGAGITPEAGVGGHAHTVALNNLYDLDADSLRLKEQVSGPQNEYINLLEAAILDAGFDGYVSDFGKQRAAVLIGRHAVPVRYEGMTKPEVPAGERAIPNDIKRIGEILGKTWVKRTPTGFRKVLMREDLGLYQAYADAFTGTGRTYWPDEMVREISKAYPPQREEQTAQPLPETITIDGANPNINFMRGPTKQDASNLWDWIKTETEAGVEAFSRKVGLGTLTNEQMADRWGKEFAPLKTIANVLDATEAKAAQWEKKAEDADRDWAALTVEQDQLMSEIMGDASLHGYDPDTGQLPVGHISKEQRARVMAAKMTLDARWQRLKTLDANGKHKAVAVYRQVRDYHQQRLQEAINYVRAQLQQKGTVRPDDPLLKSLEALEAMGKRPYFPLMRLGDYYVVGMSPQMADLEKRFRAKQLQPDEDALREKLRRDPKHYWVEGASRLATAKRLAEKLRKEMGFAQYNAERYKLANARSHVGQDVGKFEQALEGMALDTKTHDALVEMYEQLLISAMPEHHSLKRTLHREGIYGWDKNMRAVFAKTAQTGAWALSRMMHVSDLQQAMSELDEMSKTGEPNAQDARALHNELLARQDLTFTRYEDPLLVQGAMKFSYLSMLGFSPAFWMINLTQPWMVTLPYLTARNGNEFKATSSALWRGVREAFSMIEASTEGKELRTQFNPDKANQQGQKVRLTADERRMLDTFGADGTLDFTIGYDLGAIAKGGSDKWQKVMRSINAPTHATELANRVGTALAAYRISRQSQHSHEQALEFAKKAVNTTQVNYNPANKARYMQAWAGNRWLPKLAFQFYTYQQAMAYLALSTLRDAIKGDKVAQSTMAWMTGMLGVTGGVFALPFSQMALGAASLIFSALGGGDDEEDVDFQRDLRNLFSDHLPEPVARLLNKGLGSILLQTDLGARIGMGNLMNPLAFARFEAADKGADTVQEVLFRMGGAPVANVANAVDGLSAMRDVMGALVTGDAPKGSDINDMFAKLFPLKGVRDIFRGNELFNEGVTTGEGEPRITDFSALETLIQGLGITPLRKTMYYDRNAAIQGAKEAMKVARGDLIREYAQARLAGEPIGPILAKIGAFNRRNPQHRIDQDTLKRSTTQRQKDRQSLDNGILANKENRPYLAAGRWAE